MQFTRGNLAKHLNVVTIFSLKNQWKLIHLERRLDFSCYHARVQGLFLWLRDKNWNQRYFQIFNVFAANNEQVSCLLCAFKILALFTHLFSFPLTYHVISIIDVLVKLYAHRWAEAFIILLYNYLRIHLVTYTSSECNFCPGLESGRTYHAAPWNLFF